jgi:transposase InsO family protein
MAVSLIHEAVEAGARKKKACEELEVSVRTMQRWEREGGLEDRRKGSPRRMANKLSDAEKEEILKVCNEPRFRSLPPTQVVPALADEGRYLASESSFYRVLREADQVHCRGRAKAPREVARPRGYKATSPNQVWSWDITYLAASVVGMFFRLYLMMDVFSRKIVGWEVHERELSEHASVLIRKATLAEGIAGRELVLHSDNGGPMKGATMLATLQRLGVVPSFSRPSVSDDNPYSEALFRTLKYTPAWPPKRFESLNAAREWVKEFVHWYNHVHRHSALKFVTPAQRHEGLDAAILARREQVYDLARKQHPERWSGKVRNWQRVEEVWLNPPRESHTGAATSRKAA